MVAGSVVASAGGGGNSLYITGVTSRASSVEEINPPMATDRQRSFIRINLITR